MNEPIDDFEVAARLSHVQPLVTLRNKINPKQAALIVIDMQNDFCAEGGMMSREGFDITAVQKAATRLPALIAAARSAGALVVFVRNVYSTSTIEFACKSEQAGQLVSFGCLAGASRAQEEGKLYAEAGVR